MARKRYTAEQIIGYLRQAEVMIGQGRSMEDVLREIGVTANTYYRCRKEYGGMGTDQAQRRKEAVIYAQQKLGVSGRFAGQRRPSTVNPWPVVPRILFQRFVLPCHGQIV